MRGDERFAGQSRQVIAGRRRSEDAAPRLQAPSIRIWEEASAIKEFGETPRLRQRRDVPQGFNIHQDRLFAGRDEIVAVAIDGL
jgi:hypothetical protein